MVTHKDQEYCKCGRYVYDEDKEAWLDSVTCNYQNSGYCEQCMRFLDSDGSTTGIILD